ncbi:MAG TPA: hypothetical protein VFV58_12610 [Blastocatellia bacterium]|jgi:hypothetical protein|nr:hypothetical protein [Blastocatellia bacterium]
MNQNPKKTASKGEAKKKQEAQAGTDTETSTALTLSSHGDQHGADPAAETNTESDAEKLAKEIAASDARKHADPGVELINELMMMRWKQEGEVLKQEAMPIEQVRVTMGLMYARMNQIASYICEMMLKDLFNAEIIQRGPQWDESIALSKMAWHLQADSELIEMNINEFLKAGQAASRKEYGTAWELHQIVYRHYKYLRLERGWLFKPPPKVQTELREEAWRRANQESRVKEILEGKDRWAVGEEKYKALTQARYNWRRDPEIKALKDHRTPQR